MRNSLSIWINHTSNRATLGWLPQSSGFPIIPNQHSSYVGVVSTPLKNISQLGLLFPIYGKIKNVPNHQPAGMLKWGGHSIYPDHSGSMTCIQQVGLVTIQKTATNTDGSTIPYWCLGMGMREWSIIHINNNPLRSSKIQSHLLELQVLAQRLPKQYAMMRYPKDKGAKWLR